jgi:hypothetical protein
MTNPRQQEVADFDLDAEDNRLREAVGRPTAIRVKGKIVHFGHALTWSGNAMDAAVAGNFSVWAAEVIEDEEELEHFLLTKPMAYQYEAIFEQCGKTSGLDIPKSSKSGPLSPGTATRSRRTSTGSTRA